MPTDTVVLVASLSGFFGALIVTGIGVRFTRNLCTLACSGIFSGAAFGALIYVVCSWFTHGFVLLQAGVLPPAALTLLLVMTAQNWFVFYEDRADVLQSSRPALVILAGALAAVLARNLAAGYSTVPLLIWAGTASLAILWCIDPVQRSIECTRSVPLGIIVGFAKIIMPLTGIVLFLRRGMEPGRDAYHRNWFIVNLLGLLWNLGQIGLLILINGPRIAHAPAAFDGAPSSAGEMSRLKRDSVVLIFVLALHLLCGVVIAKA